MGLHAERRCRQRVLFLRVLLQKVSNYCATSTSITLLIRGKKLIPVVFASKSFGKNTNCFFAKAVTKMFAANVHFFVNFAVLEPVIIVVKMVCVKVVKRRGVRKNVSIFEVEQGCCKP